MRVIDDDEDSPSPSRESSVETRRKSFTLLILILRLRLAKHFNSFVAYVAFKKFLVDELNRKFFAF